MKRVVQALLPTRLARRAGRPAPGRHGLLLFWPLLLLLGLLGLASPAPAHNAPPPGPPPQNLSVVLDRDYPPFVITTAEGGTQGLLIDSWRLWEKITGVPVTIIPVDWNTAQDMMARGRADVIDTLFKTPEREKIFAFSLPYATIDAPVFVHRDLGGIHDAASLRGFAVGVKRGDACIAHLTAQGVGPLVPFDDYEDLVQAAGEGKVKVFCADKPPALYYLYKLGLDEDFRIAFTLYAGRFHRAVRKGDEALLRFVDAGFARITPAQQAAIEQKWRGSSLFPSKKFQYAVWAVSGLGVAALILLSINALLRRQVRRQTTALNELLVAVRQSEERYRQLIESAASVIARLDGLGRVLFCNSFGQRLFGLDLEQMRGRNLGGLTDAPTEADSPTWREILSAVADSADGARSLDRRHRGSDGRTIWLTWSIRRVDDDADNAFLCVGSDITERKQTEQALLASEARNTLLARAANDGIWDWDILSGTVYYSPRYEDILGLPPGGMPPRLEAWTSRLHPDNAATAIRAHKQCAHGETETYSSEYRLRHADGRYRWVVERGGGLKDAHGQVLRMAGVLTDVTRRKKDEAALRESQDQLARIFRLSLVGIAVTSRHDGRILDLNETGARILGYTKEELLGRTTLSFQIWRNADERRNFVEELAVAGSVVGRELELKHKSGSTVVALLSSVPLQAYGEPCILNVLVDITERKAMERALRRAKDVAESANRAKSEFLSTMSHEIRTPMNTILGMTASLAEAGLPPEQTRALAAIEIAGSNLMGLLNDILDLSQIEAGGLIMQEKPCNIVELAGGLVEMMRPDAVRKGITIALDVQGTLPPFVSVSPDRVRQVLVNLLGNAVKFTATGGVTLEVGRKEDPEAGTLLRLAVRDTGIGIPGDMRERIFERFTQVNASTSREKGGVGLGLAICKKLVDLMGGRLHVESTPGQGSLFTVTLPLRPVAAEDAAAAVRPTPSGHVPGRPAGAILLIEDSPSNAEVTRLLLADTAFDLTWAPSGDAGLAIFRERPFDIVLMDLEMPGLDGCLTTRTLRDLETELGRPHTPVIALTAHAFEEHRNRCLAAGCDDFLTKPIAKNRLLDALDAWMAIG